MNATETILPFSDSDLVQRSLSGDRDAFGRIVSRYQALISSLAYSATGNLGQSEDLAQETFITAWKHLGRLREQNRLRAWLCGIARNRINSLLRREGREPLRDAEPLETIQESPSPGPLSHAHAISNDEAVILWRSLERIPAIYRERDEIEPRLTKTTILLPSRAHWQLRRAWISCARDKSGTESHRPAGHRLRSPRLVGNHSREENGIQRRPYPAAQCRCCPTRGRKVHCDRPGDGQILVEPGSGQPV